MSVNNFIDVLFREQRKKRHRIFRRQRSLVVFFLCNAFAEYHMMRAYKIRATSNITYKDAELLAEQMTECFGVPISTEDIIPAGKDFYDEAIKQYNRYKMLRKGLTDIITVTEEDIDAFVKALEYNSEQMGLYECHCLAAVGFASSMASVCKYFFNEIDKETLLENLKVYTPQGLVKMDEKIRYYFCKDMYRLEKEFQEIIYKRRMREIKKNLH